MIKSESTLRAADWEAFLEEHTNAPVWVVYGRSRSAPVQLRGLRREELRRRPEKKGGWHLRLHRVFAGAPEDVQAALGAWIRAGRRARKACGRLDAWLGTALAALPPKARRRAPACPRGETHDLGELTRELVAGPLALDFAGGRALPSVTWGRRTRSGARRSLRLGSYSSEADVVRIHPVLDQPAVPRWFVASVLHHELLHAVVPSERGESGRRRHHGPEFRRRECSHPDHGRSILWESRHINELIRSARTGRKIRQRLE